MTEQRQLAMITGASSGLGLELAKQFAQNGYDIALSGSSERVFEAAETIRGLGAEAYPHQADAAEYKGVESFWNFVKELDRPLEAAVLNVGIGLGGPFAETKLEDELRLISINISGTVHMAKRVVQHMLPNGRGKIMVVSSIAATLPTPYETVYGPSKAFGFSFAEALREELRGTGVNVTAFLPGPTDTNFHDNAGMGSSEIGSSEKNDKELVARQGFEALMNNVDQVVGGDEKTKQEAEENRRTPEPEKAARHAERARPRD
ncbi:SDR family NAD(P)-dependent oxidoreductase [Metabacillus sp. GX 13764]|uniref:SDR family NAD(P)-dependent oxidoreductase n=1 Tax=Metabacillus kandeliae TaxID=2900151 RepID=UPI001E350E82|nr:SDR family NAD(P)-dependent oxidoreductase [Metabacillus kandeliae]MCD7035691.1 SDR family NAD(P)-dependent oxidoreductase [Metabacillus kandeliae]